MTLLHQTVITSSVQVIDDIALLAHVILES